MVVLLAMGITTPLFTRFIMELASKRYIFYFLSLSSRMISAISSSGIGGVFLLNALAFSSISLSMRLLLLPPKLSDN